eukprot:6063711-Prymnesium_polylepis.1
MPVLKSSALGVAAPLPSTAAALAASKTASAWDAAEPTVPARIFRRRPRRRSALCLPSRSQRLRVVCEQ